MTKTSDLNARLVGGALLFIPALFCLWQGGLYAVGLVWVCFGLMALELGVLAWEKRKQFTTLTSKLLIWGGFAYLLLAFVALHHTVIPLWGKGICFQTPFFLIYLIALVVCTDIGAYAVGRTVGGPLLAPRISPKKTWSGFFGGLFFGTLGGMGVLFLIGGGDSYLLGFFVTLYLSLCSQGGDLLESWVKRRLNIKDSSQWIPGHGGFWDRFDGFLSASIGWFFFRFFL